MRKGRKITPPEIRFQRLFTKQPSGCWEWQGKIWKKGAVGYGSFRIGERGSPQVKVHRYAYELWKGPIPEGLCVCHSCDNKICVNPEHLWLGTSSDNAKDMWQKGRGRPCAPRGEASGAAKLTENEVLEIRELLEQSIPKRDLADMFNVSPSLIQAIKKRLAWAWL